MLAWLHRLTADFRHRQREQNSLTCLHMYVPTFRLQIFATYVVVLLRLILVGATLFKKSLKLRRLPFLYVCVSFLWVVLPEIRGYFYNEMRYINLRFTYLLTYWLLYRSCNHEYQGFTSTVTQTVLSGLVGKFFCLLKWILRKSVNGGRRYRRTKVGCFWDTG